MDYQKFKLEFIRSGKSQRAYSEQIGISPSMVSYYLSRARKEPIVTATSGFSEITLNTSVSDRQIKIITPSGLEILIPI